jgi:hypothetical protein
MGAIVAFFFFYAKSCKDDEEGNVAITLFFSADSYIDEEEGDNIVAFFSISTSSYFYWVL